MEFRLTYEGPLRSSGSGKDARPARREHKHQIRKAFHTQLKELWDLVPHLRIGDHGGPAVLVTEGDNAPARTADELSKKFALYGFNFVPMVTEDLELGCHLDILYLRRSDPKNVLQSTGDIDNRVKTLLDALQIPDAHQGYSDKTPEEDEKPFFCLLEDDRLVNKLAVETDLLLHDVENPDNDHENDAHVVVTARIRPLNMHLWNLQFG